MHGLLLDQQGEFFVRRSTKHLPAAAAAAARAAAAAGDVGSDGEDADDGWRDTYDDARSSFEWQSGYEVRVPPVVRLPLCMPVCTCVTSSPNH